MVYATAKAEKLVEQRLAKQGFTAYCPTSRKWRQVRRSKKRVRVEAPLFPRYLFVATKGADWGAIRATEGVGGFLTREATDGRGRASWAPVRVSGAIVEAIQVNEDMGMFDATIAPDVVLFRAGCSVRIASGPFEGRMGVVRRAPGKGAKAVQVAITGDGHELDAKIPVDLLRLLA